MIYAVIALAAVCIVSEVLHFRHERELLRRLMTKDNAEYVKNYESDENKKPLPPSPSVEAMKRWKAGKKG